MIWDSGPFYGVFRHNRWLYRLGFRWREQMRLVEGYVVGTDHLPDWASSRPGAGVVGTWEPVSRRFFWRFVPLTPWLKVSNQDSERHGPDGLRRNPSAGLPGKAPVPGAGAQNTGDRPE